MKSSILITGATGKTGQPLARQLAEKKVPFRALVHSSLKQSLLSKWTSDIVAGDYRERAVMDEALDGIEHLYLLSPPAPDQEATQKALVDSAKKIGVKHIVKLSALGASETSPVGLLRAHAAIEEYIRKSGLSWTFLRPHFFMENLLANAGSVIRDGAIYSPLGETAISTISVDDIAAVAAAVLTETGHDDRVYNLTGPEPLTYGEIAKILSTIINRKVAYVPISYEAATQAMIGMGAPEWMAEDIVRLMQSWTEGRGGLVTRDAEKVIGRQPVSVKEFLESRKDVFLGKAAKAA